MTLISYLFVTLCNTCQGYLSSCKISTLCHLEC